jgi:uncharacterized protein involved in exopolysaccharide biosynthesis
VANTRPLSVLILIRFLKLWWLLLIAAGAVSYIAYRYASGISPRYTARATLFPLNATNNNAMAASALSSMLGLPETPKSLIQEASINLTDLATSRNTREAVAQTILPSKNKSVAELLITAYNKNKTFYKPVIHNPGIGTDSGRLMYAIGGALILDNLFTKINKNGILEINFTAHDPELAGFVVNTFVDKLTYFYRDLKMKKAMADFSFMSRKVDSLGSKIKSLDRKSISVNKRSKFVPPSALEYKMPIINNDLEKSRIMRQRELTSDSREEALWRIQRETPVIAMLDKPDPPYAITKPSKSLYAVGGFMAGLLIFGLLLITDVIFMHTRNRLLAIINESATPVAAQESEAKTTDEHQATNSKQVTSSQPDE